MTALTQISGPLVGYASLAPRPHSEQAIPPAMVPVVPISPPLAPASAADLMFLDERELGNVLQFKHESSSAGDLRYRDGTNI